MGFEGAEDGSSLPFGDVASDVRDEREGRERIVARSPIQLPVERSQRRQFIHCVKVS